MGAAGRCLGSPGREFHATRSPCDSWGLFNGGGAGLPGAGPGTCGCAARAAPPLAARHHAPAKQAAHLVPVPRIGAASAHEPRAATLEALVT